VIISGVLHVESLVGIVNGLESLFHALEGIVPLIKACRADAPKIEELFRQVADFKHPAELAKLLGHNILANGVDITLETASAVLDCKSKNWGRLGEDVGTILG